MSYALAQSFHYKEKKQFMIKKTVMIAALFSLFAACKNGTATSDKTTPGNSSVIHNSPKESSSMSRGKESTYEMSPASTDSNTKHTTQKKGWSNRAKGAVIGGAAGAVGGAIISKKKGTGAVIGGLAGAAGGYIIGNEKDKKQNR